MSIKYRLANQDDIDSLVDLRLKLIEYNCKTDGIIIQNNCILKENTKRVLRDELNKSMYFFLAIDTECDKVIAGGGVIIHTLFPNAYCINGMKGYITGVYTDEGYRRLGLQKQIIKMCLDLSREKKCQRIELDAVNPHAIELYKLFGFQKVSNKYRIDMKSEPEK